jgi:energy-coupling factor transporter transmembrane protein EcfT
MTAPDLPRRERRPHRSWWRRHTLDLTMTAALAVVAAVVAVVAGVL